MSSKFPPLKIIVQNNMTFSLRLINGITCNNVFDISFSLWFDWGIQVSSKMFYGHRVYWSIFWKLIYFPCIPLSSFTQIIITLANAVRFKLSSIWLLYFKTWGECSLEHWNDLLHLVINLSSLNQLLILLIKINQPLPSLRTENTFLD